MEHVTGLHKHNTTKDLQAIIVATVSCKHPVVWHISSANADFSCSERLWCTTTVSWGGPYLPGCAVLA